jgi:TRAP transporter TAXI family solute receptor
MRFAWKPLTLTNREYVAILVPALLVTLIGFWVAYKFVQPAPPNRIVISTGREDGAYYLFAQRYRQILARSHVTLVVRPSAGSIENLVRLRSETSGTDLAFVQGGTSTPQDAKELYSLGSLYYEPVWVFYRSQGRLTKLNELRGKRIVVGEAGSGTKAVALRLLADNGITQSVATFLQLGGSEAAAALLNGSIDTAFFIASPKSPVIQQLLRSDRVRLMSFERGEAYTRLYPYLARVTLPRGVIDLERDIPTTDIVLLAPTAQLAARQDFHPALVSLLLQAAEEVNGVAGLFQSEGEFPSPKNLELPLSPDAKHYYKRGPRFFQRYLPFWVATFVDRMVILLVPLVALVWPMFRLIPPLYRWRTRRKIYRWYKNVKAVETASSAKPAPLRPDAFLRELDRIENEVLEVSVPLAYADQLYNLRMHIELVRERLEAAAQAHVPP